jgi:hypothetical protein
MRPRSGQGLPSLAAFTPCATPLPRMGWKAEWIWLPYNACWAMTASQLPCVRCMWPGATPLPRAHRSITYRHLSSLRGKPCHGCRLLRQRPGADSTRRHRPSRWPTSCASTARRFGPRTPSPTSKRGCCARSLSVAPLRLAGLSKPVRPAARSGSATIPVAIATAPSAKGLHGPRGWRRSRPCSCRCPTSMSSSPCLISSRRSYASTNARSITSCSRLPRSPSRSLPVIGTPWGLNSGSPPCSTPGARP